jgi:8-hydroxy-5-deazaflavin:NADPH oxidoreductase
MATAVIGLGNIGKVVARELARGGEPVVLASRHESDAAALADEIGAQASAGTVAEAIAEADVILLAVWFDVMKELIEQHREALSGKVVIDPSNPVAFGENGEVGRTLPDGVSSGSVIAGLLPPGAHFVKAFGTLLASSLASGANRDPKRAVLFYATDDDIAAAAVERLISAAGFDPVKAGGLEASLPIESFGELAEMGGLNGKLLDRDEAKAAVAGVAA